MRALVIYESMYGNTEQVAEAIAEGLGSTLSAMIVEVAEAPLAVPDDVTLLVVGGPTHAFGMSRPATRTSAAEHRPEPVISASFGVREWLHQLARPEHAVTVAAFDTHLDHPRMLARVGSAAAGIDKELHHFGCARADDPQHFWVAETLGPLRDGELDRARAWGARLAAMAPVARTAS